MSYFRQKSLIKKSRFDDVLSAFAYHDFSFISVRGYTDSSEVEVDANDSA